jgi:hypothetical protein
LLCKQRATTSSATFNSDLVNEFRESRNHLSIQLLSQFCGAPTFSNGRYAGQEGPEENDKSNFVRNPRSGGAAPTAIEVVMYRVPRPYGLGQFLARRWRSRGPPN